MRVYQEPPISEIPDVLPRLYVLLRAERYCGIFYFEAYIAASHLSEWLIDGKSRRELIDDIVRRVRGANPLPIGEPDWHHSRVSDSYTAIPGDVVLVRATWPSERELAV